MAGGTTSWRTPDSGRRRLAPEQCGRFHGGRECWRVNSYTAQGYQQLPEGRGELQGATSLAEDRHHVRTARGTAEYYELNKVGALAAEHNELNEGSIGEHGQVHPTVHAHRDVAERRDQPCTVVPDLVRTSEAQGEEVELRTSVPGSLDGS